MTGKQQYSCTFGYKANSANVEITATINNVICGYVKTGGSVGWTRSPMGSNVEISTSKTVAYRIEVKLPAILNGFTAEAAVDLAEAGIGCN